MCVGGSLVIVCVQACTELRCGYRRLTLVHPVLCLIGVSVCIGNLGTSFGAALGYQLRLNENRYSPAPLVPEFPGLSDSVRDDRVWGLYGSFRY